MSLFSYTTHALQPIENQGHETLVPINMHCTNEF